MSTAVSAHILRASGFLSPFAAHARIVDAISALIAEVRFGSGSEAVASSRTDFISSINSGWNTAPLGFTFATSEKANPALDHLNPWLSGKQLLAEGKAEHIFRLAAFGCNAAANSGTKVPDRPLLSFAGDEIMQAAIDRVMQTYGMLVNLTVDEERRVRDEVSKVMARSNTDDENKLAVEGLKYLRSAKGNL